jgi:hypothetical protein
MTTKRWLIKPWIYTIILHVYTSLAYVMKQNDLLLCTCLPTFCNIVGRKEKKQFSGNQHEFAKELSFTLKMASKMVNSLTAIGPYLANICLALCSRFISWQSFVL